MHALFIVNAYMYDLYALLNIFICFIAIRELREASLKLIFNHTYITPWVLSSSKRER